MNPYRAPYVPPPDLVEEQAFADLHHLETYRGAGLIPPLGSRALTPRMKARLAAGEPYEAVVRAHWPDLCPDLA